MYIFLKINAYETNAHSCACTHTHTHTHVHNWRKGLLELLCDTKHAFSNVSIVPGFQHVHFVADPCTLVINNVVFGITSTDVLFHLSAEEVALWVPWGCRYCHQVALLLDSMCQFISLFFTTRWQPSQTATISTSRAAVWKWRHLADFYQVLC